jgi:hypothetical protein
MTFKAKKVMTPGAGGRSQKKKKNGTRLSWRPYRQRKNTGCP